MTLIGAGNRLAKFQPVHTRNTYMDTVPPPPPVQSLTPTASSSEDKTVAILAYLTVIGLIVAIVMHGNKKTQLGAYHLRQSLGLMVTGLALWAAVFLIALIPFIGWMISLASFVLWIGLFVLWLIGFIAAVSGQFKPIPLLGEHYQKWFSTAFE